MAKWVAADITILTSSKQVGGPRMVTGTIAVIAGDTGGSIDLSDYFAKEIKSIVSLSMETSGTNALLTTDITTVATTLTVTHTNPAAAAIIHFAVLGQ